MGEHIRSWLLVIVACHLIGAQTRPVGAANDANNSDSNKDSNGDLAQPSLPNPFISSAGGAQSMVQPIVRLVSEVNSMNGGPIVSQEEYLDLASDTDRRYALVRSNTREVLLSMGSSGLLLSYRPYTCTVHKDTKVFNNELDDLTADFQEGMPRVFGLLGIWLDAAARPHTYEFVKSKYADYEGPGKHVFTVTRDDTKLTVRLSFSEPGLLPELVELVDSRSHSTLKSFRVLSFETGLMELPEEVLEIPVGFDCSRALNEAARGGGEAGKNEGDGDNDDDEDENFLKKYLFSNAYAKFEVSATKLNREAQQAEAVFKDGDKRSNWMDTIYVELAHSSIGTRHKSHHFGLLMTKIKSKQQDSRTILNHFYNVQYYIDSRQGTCKMSHLNREEPQEWSDEQISEGGEPDELEDGRQLKFANGLEFPFHRRQMVTLLAKKDKRDKTLRRVRRSSFDKTKQIEYKIVEQPQFEWPYDKAGSAKRFARIIRTFSRTYSSQDEFISRQLESVTLWLVAPEQDWIMESYHFNLIKSGRFNSWLDVAETFDISEDCYLGDARKLAGQDFAWVDLYYPLSSRQMNLLNEKENFAKSEIYSSYMSSDLWTPFSMPRLELMFTDEALIVRFLLLELPDLELVFDSKQRIKLLEGTGLISHRAPNLRHCARLCQLNDCYSMSFCENSRNCVLSKQPVEPGELREELRNATHKTSNETLQYATVAKMGGCVTYSHVEPGRVPLLREQRLAYVLSRLRYQDFDLAAPKMPDELALPRSETGTSLQDRAGLFTQYQMEFNKFNQEHTNRVAALTWWANLQDQMLIVMPTMCLVEDDPLAELSFKNPTGGGKPDDQEQGGTLEEVHGDDVRLHDLDQVVQFFDIVLSNQCLDMDRYAQSKDAAHHNLGNRQGAGPTFFPRLHYLPGLTYDQCALACLDSERCGLFSYWTTTSSCVLSNLAQVKEALELKFLVQRDDCLLAQRDYVQNFHKLDNVAPAGASQTSHKLVVSTPNDCALSCILASDFNCFSFDFCPKPEGQDQELANCYLLEERRMDQLDSLQASRRNQTVNEGVSGQVNLVCDHYERNYLAEFTEIPFHGFKSSKLDDSAEVTEEEDKTSFECADACLNQMADCSAFEFCTQDSRASPNGVTSYKQTCKLIRLIAANKMAQAEFEVPDDDPEQVGPLEGQISGFAEESSLLEHSQQCHVYALKPNTIQAHLRSLVLGQTMTRHEHEQLKRRQASLGLGLTWASLFLLLVTLATISTAMGFVLYWSRERFGLVSYYSGRIESLFGSLTSRG